ncbi:F-box/kelch-repeat protein At3g23880-like [Rosa rugosa]|uniref:F-box/kelch-repeat protein At3g23880-like n=1 Tax=Rosa rugosa TaxID=74645 RepID=UPI002B412030|nr:F-box/kelch-repeat protein At3g23880-like [Rosa rugosa]
MHNPLTDIAKNTFGLKKKSMASVEFSSVTSVESMASPKAMATMTEHLPEEIITQILYRLPLKQVIRFSCTSRRWRSIVSDPQFAKSYFKFAFERRTLSHRLLLSTPSHMESLDLQTSSFVDDSSIRKLTCPFKQPGRTVFTLGSCNGYYIWNPSTGLFLKLPNPGFALKENKTISCLHHCGFGYVSATDNYKVVVAAPSEVNPAMPIEVFSSKSSSWKRIESPPHFSLMCWVDTTRDSLTNEALHWLDELREPELDTSRYTITAFDLDKEEFREMSVPISGIHFVLPIFYTERRVVMWGTRCWAREMDDHLIRFDHNEEEKLDRVAV